MIINGWTMDGNLGIREYSDFFLTSSPKEEEEEEEEEEQQQQQLLGDIDLRWRCR